MKFLTFILVIGSIGLSLASSSLVPSSSTMNTLLNLLAVVGFNVTLPLGSNINGASTPLPNQCTVNVNLLDILNSVLGNTYLGNLQCNANDPGQVESIIPPKNFFGSCYTVQNINGKYICGASCGGKQDTTQCEAQPILNNYFPISAYPFHCKCPSDGCDSKREPNTQALGPPLSAYSVKCVPDQNCKCTEWYKDNTNDTTTYTGHICNWIPVIPTTLSPIRWCTCCPNN